MGTGTAALAAPRASEATRPADVWVTLAEASRLSGLHETTILRLALAGDVRHRVRGRRTLFSGEDVRRISS